MRDLFNILQLEEEAEICKEMLLYYNDTYDYFEQNKSILATVFNTPDITLHKKHLALVEYDMMEQLEVDLEDIIQDQIPSEVSLNIQYELETNNISILDNLLDKEGITLVKGLDILKSILETYYKLNSNIKMSVHIDRLICRISKKPEMYYLQINFYKA